MRCFDDFTCFAGHSKSGNNVLLFAAKHDGDVPLVINLAGRFDMKAGITKHFSPDVFERLEKEGAVEQTLRTAKGVITWMLTKEVRPLWQLTWVLGLAADCCRQIIAFCNFVALSSLQVSRCTKALITVLCGTRCARRTWTNACRQTCTRPRFPFVKAAC